MHVVVLTEPTQDNAIQEIQTRIWASLKSGYKYSGTADDSEKYLRPLVGKRLDLTIMYVDLVGSTSMSLEISQTKFITIISSFVHEMAHAVKRHNGYVWHYLELVQSIQPRAQVQYVIKVCFHRISWYAVMSIVHTKIMYTLSNFY